MTHSCMTPICMYGAFMQGSFQHAWKLPEQLLCAPHLFVMLMYIRIDLLARLSNSIKRPEHQNATKAHINHRRHH